VFVGFYVGHNRARRRLLLPQLQLTFQRRLKRPVSTLPRMAITFPLLTLLRRLRCGKYPRGDYLELVDESFAKAPLPQLVKNGFDGRRRGCRDFVFGRCAFWFSPGGSA